MREKGLQKDSQKPVFGVIFFYFSLLCVLQNDKQKKRCNLQYGIILPYILILKTKINLIPIFIILFLLAAHISL